uniref:Uncharacterized protein n=1 Tax=Pipistrellus kuhlii TaxID=59472 RepID=A0A7J8A7G6_PIPKU|nr:hypothetical protein mPipKuh1_008839 [Pipistrellus kuhlii]
MTNQDSILLFYTRFTAVRTPRLHQTDQHGGLGGSSLYKRWPSLCLLSVHFQFLPQTCTALVCNLFTGIKSLHFLIFFVAIFVFDTITDFLLRIQLGKSQMEEMCRARNGGRVRAAAPSWAHHPPSTWMCPPAPVSGVFQRLRYVGMNDSITGCRRLNSISSSSPLSPWWSRCETESSNSLITGLVPQKTRPHPPRNTSLA